jgi:hypothetical protein
MKKTKRKKRKKKKIRRGIEKTTKNVFARVGTPKNFNPQKYDTEGFCPAK